MHREEFWVACLLLILAVILQIRMAGVALVIPDAALAVLIAAGAIIGLGETALLALCAAWALNWQPRLGFELGLFFVLPLAFGIVRSRLPWQGWFSNVIAVALATIIFNGLTAGKIIFAAPGAFLFAFVSTVGIGAFTFQLIRLARRASRVQRFG